MIRFDKNGNMFKEPSPASLVWWVTILALMYIALFIFSCIRIDKVITGTQIKVDAMYEHYDDLAYENEILWTYVENIDSFKTLEDAIQARDDVYDMIQFIDE